MTSRVYGPSQGGLGHIIVLRLALVHNPHQDPTGPEL